MTMNNVHRDHLPNGFWANFFVPRANGRLKDLTANRDDEEQLSYWQLVFLQSKTNGCFYDFAALPQANWQWPQKTWFRERLRKISLRDGELDSTSRMGIMAGESLVPDLTHSSSHPSPE